MQIPERKKKWIFKDIAFFKETKKQQNLKKYNNTLVFAHSDSFSDDNSISIKITKPVAFLARFLYSLLFFLLNLHDLVESCIMPELHDRYLVKSGLHVLQWLKVVNEHNHLLTSYNWIVVIHKSPFLYRFSLQCSLLTVLFTLSSFFYIFHNTTPLKKDVKLDSFFFLFGVLSSKVITTSSSFSEDIFNKYEIIYAQLKKSQNN